MDFEVERVFGNIDAEGATRGVLREKVFLEIL